jgi:hypothetical protein
MDHEVVKLMIRSFTSCNATLVSLICGNPMYKKMSPKEVLGKFLSHEMMVRHFKYIKDCMQGNVSSTEPQVVAFKETSEMEEVPIKEETIDVSGHDDEEMMLTIKSFIKF